jgi:N-acetyl-gamma-glutamyl-phosphate reductase
MLNAGIVGATGYAGEELIDVLLRHPQARIRSLAAKIGAPRAIDELFPKFKGRIDLVCNEPDLKDIAAKCELVFLALPHTVSMDMVPLLLKAGKKVIDLSADYRLRDTKVYQAHYHTKHKDIANLKKACYGLPELYRAKIKGAQLIANPGCYPTCAILALAPLVALGLVDLEAVIIDAKSGSSGAGRKLSEGLLFSEVDEDFKAYKVNCHQHAPEIDQALSKLAGKNMRVVFVPHLLPIKRGILETIYARKVKGQGSKAEGLVALYKKFYKDEPFVRINKEGQFPSIKDVAGTNFCDIGIREDCQNVIVIAAIDNLLKGASGQAVQNMNIMYGFPESTALV